MSASRRTTRAVWIQWALATRRDGKIWDPQVELDATDAPVLDINQVYRGGEACRRFWREWFSAWETIAFDQAQALRDAGLSE
ncbi:MAG: hypothetical protein ACRDJY_12465 [Thermoleophilaceae bacterium]